MAGNAAAVAPWRASRCRDFSAPGGLFAIVSGQAALSTPPQGNNAPGRQSPLRPGKHRFAIDGTAETLTAKRTGAETSGRCAGFNPADAGQIHSQGCVNALIGAGLVPMVVIPVLTKNAVIRADIPFRVRIMGPMLSMCHPAGRPDAFSGFIAWIMGLTILHNLQVRINAPFLWHVCIKYGGILCHFFRRNQSKCNVSLFASTMAFKLAESGFILCLARFCIGKLRIAVAGAIQLFDGEYAICTQPQSFSSVSLP